MAESADRIVVEVLGDLNNLQRNSSSGAAQFDRSMATIENSARRAERQVVVSSGAMANAQRNLGRQISDIGTQLASGSSPFLILAQQAPQVADALSDTGGRAAQVAAFFAGPWGAALLAGASVLGVLVGKLFEASEAHEQAKKAADAHREAEQLLNDVLQGTINLSERARIASLDKAKAQAYEAKVTLSAAKAQLQLAQSYLAAQRAAEGTGLNTFQIPGRGASSSQVRVQQRQSALDQAQSLVNSLEIRNRNLERIATSARAIEAKRESDKADKSAAAAARKREAAERRAEAEARRAEREAQRRAREQLQANEELLRGRAELAQAEADLTSDTRLQDQALRTRITTERDVAKARISADPNLSSAQKAERNDIEDRIATAKLRKVNIDEAQRYLEEELSLRKADLNNQRDIAASQADLADTNAQRREAALRILDLQYEIERSELEAVIASKKSTDVQRQIAQKRLDVLGTLQANDRAGVVRNTEGSLARYRREIYGDINERVEDIEVRGLRTLEDELVKSTTAALGLKGALGDIVGELVRIGIQRQIIGPLADALFGPAQGSGGGAGGFGSGAGSIGGFIMSLFGRASGGYVAPNSVHRVNEGAGGVELLKMGPQGGTVIPLGRAKAAQPAAGVTVLQTVAVDARGAVMNDQFATMILQRAGQNAQQISAAYSGAAVQAAPARTQRLQTLGT